MIDEYRLYINRDLPILQRGCTSKAGFETRREARHTANHGRTRDGSLRPYHCSNCDLWHLGHRRRAHG